MILNSSAEINIVQNFAVKKLSSECSILRVEYDVELYLDTCKDRNDLTGINQR